MNKHLESLTKLITSLTIPRRLGFSMLAFGLIIILGLASFHALGVYSAVQLKTLNVEFDAPATIPKNAAPFKIESVMADTLDSDDSKTNLESNLNNPKLNSQDPKILIPSSESSKDISTKKFLLFYNSDNIRIIHPKYWNKPLLAGTDPYLPKTSFKPKGFQSIQNNDWRSVDVFSVAMQMSVPLVQIDASVSELEIIARDNHFAYETPKNVIGHIPQSANPAEIGNGWYFGHIESPIAKEGSVFHKLPEIATLLRDGEPVYIVISNTKTEFLYQVVSSQVIHKDELELYDSDDYSITLVTCSNRPYYDHRQLVTGKLIGFKKMSSVN